MTAGDCQENNMVASATQTLQELDKKLKQNSSSRTFALVAEYYFRQKHIQHAIEICLSGLRQYPDSLTGRLVLGKCYLAQEKLQDAIQEFLHVAAADRKNQAALSMLAEIYSRMGKNDVAGDIYAYLLTTAPDNALIKRLSEVFPGTDRNIFETLALEPKKKKEYSAAAQSCVLHSTNEALFLDDFQSLPSQSPIDEEAVPVEMDSHEPKSIATPEPSATGDWFSTPVEESVPDTTIPDNNAPIEPEIGIVDTVQDIIPQEDVLQTVVAVDTVQPVADAVPLAIARPDKDDADEELQQHYAIPDHVLTPTLAEIYFQQGQSLVAMRIYARLLHQNPDNDKLKRRLEEIKQIIADADEQPDGGSRSAQQHQKPLSARGVKPLAGVRIKKEIKAKLKDKN
jgi:tetratricopeptide (TPR) repeat protein